MSKTQNSTSPHGYTTLAKTLGNWDALALGFGGSSSFSVVTPKKK